MDSVGFLGDRNLHLVDSWRSSMVIMVMFMAIVVIGGQLNLDKT